MDEFDSAGGEPGVNMRLRAQLQDAIREMIAAWGIGQREAAGRLGICRARLNYLVRGRLDKFSIDALVNIAALGGISVELVIEDAGPPACAKPNGCSDHKGVAVTSRSPS